MPSVNFVASLKLRHKGAADMAKKTNQEEDASLADALQSLRTVSLASVLARREAMDDLRAEAAASAVAQRKAAADSVAGVDWDVLQGVAYTVTTGHAMVRGSRAVIGPRPDGKGGWHGKPERVTAARAAEILGRPEAILALEKSGRIRRAK